MAKCKKSPTSEWLAGPDPEPATVRCWICRDNELADEVAVFHRAKRAGETSRSWAAYYRDVLVGHFGWKGSFSALNNHIHRHLDRDG